MEQPSARGDLLLMPLHDITELHGPEGLQARFDLEILRFSTEDQDRLSAARDLALKLHEADRREGGQHYSEHLLRVAIRIVSPSHYGVEDPDVAIAALLHDSVEDHASELVTLAAQDLPLGLSVKEKAFWVISHQFNSGVASLVKALTNPDFDKSDDWQAEYHRHVQQTLLGEPRARIIKISDFADNGVGIHYSQPERLEYFATKYQPLVPIFRELIMMDDTPLTAAAKQYILRQLDSAEERFARILQKDQSTDTSAENE